MSADNKQMLQGILASCGLQADASLNDGFMIFSGAYCVGVARTFKGQSVWHLPNAMHRAATQILATQYLYQPAFCDDNTPPLLPQQLRGIQQFLEALNAQEASR
jgi:hypothetical protein